MERMDEKDFTRSLRAFHGPEKYTELLRITLFGKKINLFKFYQSAKKRGGSTEGVIMTRWRDICVEIGALHSAYNVSLEESHKASQFFCDCFHDFKYPNPNPPSITRYGRKTKPKTFPNDYDLPYKNTDNYRSLKGSVSDENLIWMANNAAGGSKYKFVSLNEEEGKQSNQSILDNQWVLPLSDKSFPIPYSIQSKVACAAKLATETKLPKREHKYESSNRDNKPYKGKKKLKTNGEKETNQTAVKNIMHEVSKFLITGHDLEVCLSIILKSLTVTSMPHIPGLCKYLSQISQELTKKLKEKMDFKTHKELFHILELLVNILTLIVRDFFIRFSRETENIGPVLEQLTMCLDSLKNLTSLILLKIKDLFKDGHFKKNNFTINTRDMEKERMKKLNKKTGKAENREKGNKKNGFEPLQLNNKSKIDEEDPYETHENDEINYNQILLNILILMKFLAKTSTEMWQFELICGLIDPLLKNLSYAITDFKAPKYWLWEEFQECLKVLFSACHHICKQISGKMQISSVGNLYLLMAVLIQEERISKTLFRKIVEILLTFHSYFDFEKLNFMKFSIKKACQKLVQIMIDYPVTNKINGQSDKKNYQEEEKENNYTLYSKQAMKYLDRTFKRRSQIKDNLDNEFLDPDNPMCNPWSSLPWDHTSLKTNNSHKRKPELADERLKRKRKKLTNGNLEEEEDITEDSEKENQEKEREYPNGKNKSELNKSAKNTRASPLKMFFNDTVDADEKLTLEESVEYLQQFYKVVFGITDNDKGSAKQNGVSKNGIVICNGKEEKTSKKAKVLNHKGKRTNGDSGKGDKNHCEEGQQEEDGEDQPAIDYEVLYNSKYSKSTKELVSLCLVEMAKYEYCLDVIKRNYNEILDSAFEDNSTRPLWTLIHQLQVTRTCSAFD